MSKSALPTAPSRRAPPPPCPLPSRRLQVRAPHRRRLSRLPPTSHRRARRADTTNDGGHGSQLAKCDEAIQCFERGSTLLEELDFTQSERVHIPPWLQSAGPLYQHAVQTFGLQTFDVELQINAFRSEINALMIPLRQHREALRREQDGAPAAASADAPADAPEYHGLSADAPADAPTYKSLSATSCGYRSLREMDGTHLELQEVATAKEWRALQGAYLDALRSAFSQPLPDGLADAHRAELQTLTLTADSPPPQPTDAVDVLVFVCSPTVEPLAKAPAEAFAVADAAERAGKLAYIQHGGDGSMLRQRLDQLTPRMLLFVGHADATQRNGACIVLAKSRIRY